MRAVLHDKKVVVNVIEIDDVSWPPPDNLTLLVSDDAQVGWRIVSGRPQAPVAERPDIEMRNLQARSECARRILAVASPATQANLTLYLGVVAAKTPAQRSTLEANDLVAIAEALEWISAMRSTWRVLANDGEDVTQDSHWPNPSPEALALARRM